MKKGRVGLVFFVRATLLGSSLLVAGACGDDGGARSCTETAECLWFQACNGSYCVCDPDKCRGTCLGAACVRSDCSTSGNRCGLSGFDLCEPVADECYPSNGRCEMRADCPTFDSRHDVQCGTDGFCHATAPNLQAALLDDVPTLEVWSPTNGATFDDASAIEFQWAPQAGPVIAVVTTARPRGTYDLADPVWAAFVPPGASAVHWGDGATPHADDWTTPPSEPPSGPLFFVAAAYEGVRVDAISSPLAFRVGDDWPSFGAACEGSRPDGSECAKPDELLVCHRTRCERPCLSHADCRGIADERCGKPILGHGRFCGVDTG